MKAFLLVFLFSLSATAAPTQVLVGGYEFPPYVMNKNGAYRGLTLDFIELLNQKQKKFLFKFTPTSPSRRYHDLKEGRYQVILFENKSWGWNPSLVESTKVFHQGAEVFITLKDGTKNQDYFKNLKNKSIRGIRGYHYGFLGLSTGAKAQKDFNLELTNTPEGNIRSVLAKRADLAIVQTEFLKIYIKDHPEAQERLLVSKEYDQVYQLGALVSRKSPISAGELDKLVDTVLKDGSWTAVLKKEGLQELTLQ